MPRLICRFAFEGFACLLLTQSLPMCHYVLGRPDLRFGGLESLHRLTLGNAGAGLVEGLLQIVGLVQGLGEQGIAEVGKVGFFRAAERHSIRS
ncbi:hypothetical protein D3C80_2003320 [compost metagenome]